MGDLDHRKEVNGGRRSLIIASRLTSLIAIGFISRPIERGRTMSQEGSLTRLRIEMGGTH